ncbi:hypothetical protein F4677DRAFT_461777 [Hypoxylon crocopeplum]|nr:hypothetical protein F4677DRAFT_461777 [Hypoxylon crocopeplum]
MDAAASIAGLISLGLTVSGGLVRYCRDYRSRDADLVQLTQHARELESLLGFINDRHTGLQSISVDLDDSLQKCWGACDACLNDLKRLNARYASSKLSQNFKSRSRKLFHSLKYPFDKSKFDEIRSKLQEFNTKLLTYLQLVNLDLTRDMRSFEISKFSQVVSTIESVGRQVQSSISNAERLMTSAMRDGFGQLESSLQQGVREAGDNVTTSLGSNLCVLSGEVASLSEEQRSQALSLKDHIDQAFKLQQQQQQQQQLIELLGQVQAMSHMNDHRTASAIPTINKFRRGEGAVGESSSEMHAHSLLDSLCNCPGIRLGNLTARHKRGCIFAIENRKKRTFTMRFRAFQRHVTETWQLEYSQLAWSCGWRIHRNLTIRATVPDSAPAFNLIWEVRRAIKSEVATSQELGKVYRDCLVRLRQVFDSGKGWPTDVDGHGRGLVRIATNFTSPNISMTQCTEETATLFVQFIIALARMGIPINDTLFDHCPIQSLLRDLSPDGTPVLHDTYMVQSLIDMVDFTALDGTYLVIHVAVSWRIFELYEPFARNELLRNVLYRSESDVVRILRTDPSLLYINLLDGLTPLHLAAKWPRGLSILIEFAGEAIQSIINVQYERLETALDLAIRLAEPDSVQLLLDAGASVTSLGILVFSCLKDGARAERIACIMAESLVRQRRELYRLALQNLSTDTLEDLGLDEGVLLDEKAFDVAEALRRKSVLVPAVYDALKPGSVYHSPYINALMAQKLFDDGFHEINSRLHGFTPLMTKCYSSRDSVLELVSWFEDHGADLYAPHPMPPTTLDANEWRPTYRTIHQITYFLGFNDRILCNLRQHEDLGNKDRLSRLSRLLKVRVTDHCLCYCTVNGCIPISKYIRGFSASSSRGDFNARIPWVAGTVELAISDDNERQAALDMIRVIVFEFLGMKHTCCTYEHVYFLPHVTKHGILCLMEPAEVEEVREEDRHLAELLDILMIEFEAKFREMSIPLIRFIQEYLYPRMEEVGKERDELLPEDLHAIREIGVVLDES